MIDYDILEGNEEATEEDYYAELQSAINGGVAWRFQDRKSTRLNSSHT